MSTRLEETKQPAAVKALKRQIELNCRMKAVNVVSHSGPYAPAVVSGGDGGARTRNLPVLSGNHQPPAVALCKANTGHGILAALPLS